MKQISEAGSYVVDSFPAAVCDNIRMLQVAPESSIYRDAAYTDYKIEDDTMEAENVLLKICRKSNSKRKDEPWTRFLKEYGRKRIGIATWVN